MIRASALFGAVFALSACAAEAPDAERASKKTSLTKVGQPAKPKAPVAAPPADAKPADAKVTDTPPTGDFIVDRPIVFDAERRKLTVDYRRRHQDPSADSANIAPRMIVLHYTAGNSADGTFGYFNQVRAGPGRPGIRKAGAVNVSAHFLVDRDGTVFRLMPETTMARHVIGLNHIALGVENVGDGKKYPLTAAQVSANAKLVRYLAGRFPEIEFLIGHQEYRRFEGTSWFVERDPKYRTGKSDPGVAFLAKVRAEVADLRLKGPPEP